MKGASGRSRTAIIELIIRLCAYSPLRLTHDVGFMEMDLAQSVTLSKLPDLALH